MSDFNNGKIIDFIFRAQKNAGIIVFFVGNCKYYVLTLHNSNTCTGKSYSCNLKFHSIIAFFFKKKIYSKI